MTDAYHPAERITVTAEQAGQRLDNFLFARFRRLPKTRIYRMLRKGEVRLNGGRVKPSARIQAGDELRLPPVRLPAQQEGRTPIPERFLETIAAAVIHEDDDLLVLNKPAGIAVHGGSGVDFGVIEILRRLRPEEGFLELAHRLDRGTSGCLLLARNRTTLLALHDRWRNGGVEKAYLALVAGRWRGGGRRVDLALSREGSPGRRRQTRADDEGKTARSYFEPVERFADATLMRVVIDTGRTHQIRVHAASLGHPLLGDDRYGDFRLNRAWRQRGLKRLFLHAARLAFRLPGGRERVFDAPLPGELQRVLEGLHG